VRSAKRRAAADAAQVPIRPSQRPAGRAGRAHIAKRARAAPPASTASEPPRSFHENVDAVDKRSGSRGMVGASFIRLRI
jgi:hypothetical protein